MNNIFINISLKIDNPTLHWLSGRVLDLVWGLLVSRLLAGIAPYADLEGGIGGLDPPGKSQVMPVSIGNKQLDPLEKVGPPLENVGSPSEP